MNKRQLENLLLKAFYSRNPNFAPDPEDVLSQLRAHDRLVGLTFSSNPRYNYTKINKMTSNPFKVSK